MIRFIGPSKVLHHEMTAHMIGRHHIVEYEFVDKGTKGDCLNVLVGEEALAVHANVRGIDSYRGSIIPAVGGHKCVAIKYPSDAYFNGIQYAILDMDFSRITEEATDLSFPHLPFNHRVDHDVTESDISIYESAEYLAGDIESVKATSQIICVGFARSAWDAISISAETPLGRAWIQRLLSSKAGKIFHFGSFDTTMLELDGFTIENYTDDTIIQAHVLNPELPRDLGFLSSIYTKIPYFKSEGRTNIPGDAKAWSGKRDRSGLFYYNCKDCCATYQVWDSQRELIESDENHLHIYNYEMEMIPVARAIGMNGMLLDIDRNDELRTSLEAEKSKLQMALDIICGTKINVSSPKQMQMALYEGLGMPAKYNGEALTANNDALVSLLSQVKTQLAHLKTEKGKEPWKLRYHFITLAIKLRGIDKLLGSYINVQTHAGRIKSLYKVPGTETGRWSCSKFVDGSGLNAQTLPR